MSTIEAMPPMQRQMLESLIGTYAGMGYNVKGHPDYALEDRSGPTLWIQSEAPDAASTARNDIWLDTADNFRLKAQTTTDGVWVAVHGG